MKLNTDDGTRRESTQSKPLRPLVIGFLGRSGSGKTSLLERLIAELVARGFEVGALKHTSHGFEADRPGKDSHRLYQAGSRAVALVSREQLATFVRRRDAEPEGAPLAEAMASLPADLDVVLVEGFSWEPMPRFLVVPDSEEPLPKHAELNDVIRVVRVPDVQQGSKPDLPASLVRSLADEVTSRLAER